MSSLALAWALRQKTGSFAVRHLLTILATEAGDERGDCRPTQAYLAGLMDVDSRTVRRHLARLEKEGLIFRLGAATDQDGQFVGREIVLLMHDQARLYAAANGWLGASYNSVAAGQICPADKIVLRTNETTSQDVDDDDTTYSVANVPHTKIVRRTDLSCGNPDCITRNIPETVEISNENAVSCERAPAHAPAGLVYNYIINPSKRFPLKKIAEPGGDGAEAQLEPKTEPKTDLRSEGAAPESSAGNAASFAAFEALWPWGLTEPLEPARRAFQRLNLAERVLAIQWARGFSAAHKKPGLARRYLADKRWEPLAQGRVIAPKPNGGMVVVREGTPAFEAWQARHRAERGSQPMFVCVQFDPVRGWRGRGILRPTLFPPRAQPPPQAVVPDDVDPPEF